MFKRKKIATLCLMMAMFLNPIGYDIAVAGIMDLTGSYWITMLLFYFGSAVFFGLYFWLADISIKQFVRDLYTKIFNKNS